MCFPEHSVPRLGLLLLIAASTALCGCQWLNDSPTDTSDENRSRTIYALGRLEPETGIIDVRATPGDRLQSLDEKVRENSLAPSDGILGTLDSYDMGKSQLIALIQKREIAHQKHKHQQQLAEAQLAKAKATVAEVDAKQTELALQSERLAALGTAHDLAKVEYDRLAAIRHTDPQLVTKHQLDKKQNEMDLASKDYEIAHGSHAAATVAAAAAREAAEAALAVAAMTHAQAQENFETNLVQQEIDVAREAMKRSVLLAPNYSPKALREFIGIDLSEEDATTNKGAHAEKKRPEYTVLKILARRGEAVTQMPVMQLGDLSKMICVAEVYEADVKELSLGQEVTIRSPAFSGDYADGAFDPETGNRSGGIRGKVVHIGWMIASPGLTNRNPLAPADRSVVEVRIEIDEEATAQAIATHHESQSRSTSKTMENANAHAAKHVGLQVTVEFNPRPEDAPSNEESADQ